MVSEQEYEIAERALLSWVDRCQDEKFSIPEIVFMLQFRIYDINRMALKHFLESKDIKPTHTGENNG